jgi:uncharacterized membrane protein YfcA
VDPLMALGIGVAALLMSILGGVAGIGTAIGMIPVLTFTFGVREAIPIISVAMLFNNTSRMVANWDAISFRPAWWFIAGAVPASVAGAAVFANAPAEILARGLGVFLLALVVYRHAPVGRGLRVGTRGFLGVGTAHGFLASMFGGAGPFGAHFWLAYGLTRNAFVGTTALATLSINITKSITYGKFALLDVRSLLIATAIGAVMTVGAFIGGKLVARMPERAFVSLVEGIMVLAGVLLIIGV